jgi:hypothetical protein
MIVGSIGWAQVGVALAALTAVVTLATALINLISARQTRRGAQRPEKAIKDPTAEFALPPRPDLVNRSEELAEARGRLRAGGSVVSIEGEVGVGKSATATELAYRIHEGQTRRWRRHQSSSFVWIECGDGCPTLTELCGTLSVFTDDRALSAVARNEKFDALRRHLAERSTVLLLDNLKLSSDENSQVMVRLLKAVPRSSVVIASVNSPGALPTPRIRLSELELIEARALIRQEADRLGLSVPELHDEDFLDRMLDLFGGNPYLIISFLNGLESSPDSVEARLQAARHGDGGEAMLAEHLASLPPETLAILAVCALLRGSAIAEHLAVATRVPQDDVAVQLAGLMTKGLVTCVRLKDRPNFFTCGVGVRNAVLAFTPREEAARFTSRLATHFIERFSSDWEDATGALPHVGTFTVVAEALHAQGKGDELYALFMSVLDILFTLGKFDDRIAIASLAYRRAICEENFQRAARASAARTMNCAIRGELEAAKEMLSLGLAAAEQARLPRETARQRRVAAYVAYRSREPRRALGLLEGADELAEAAGDRHILVDLQDLRAACYWYLGEMDACESAALEHQRLSDSIPWERVKAYPLQMQAEVAMHRGAFSRAREMLAHSRVIATRYEDQRMQVRISISEARLQLLAGEVRGGSHVAAAAISQARSIGLREEVREATALRRALRWAVLPPVRLRYARRRPQRLSDAPIAGD